MRKIKNYTKQRFIVLAILLILAISVGYAALSTTLTINGTANVASNSWLIYFTNVQVTSGSVTATTLPTTSGTSTTTLTWAVNLQTPGDFYEYYVDVKNDGTIDAMIGSLSNTSLTTNQAKYLNYTVTYNDGAVIEQYDKLDAGETITLKVRVEYKTDLNPEDLPSTTETITFTYTSTYVQADGNAKNRNTISTGLNIGDSVNYTTSMYGVTLDNWRVFSIDGDYTILILAGYLPNAALDTDDPFYSIDKSGSYSVSTYYGGDTLIEAMTTKWKWDSLLTGTINGIPIDYSDTTDTNIWAMGCPTLEMYVNSWNTRYPSDTIYIAQSDSVMTGGLYGYYVGTEENPTTLSLDCSAMDGYNNTLYFPDNGASMAWGYWLASPSAYNTSFIMNIESSGEIYVYDAMDDGMAFRPIISLPTNSLR